MMSSTAVGPKTTTSRTAWITIPHTGPPTCQISSSTAATTSATAASVFGGGILMRLRTVRGRDVSPLAFVGRSWATLVIVSG
ncbi:hypothetical protein [Micromonospora sp. HM5-17]|uniref:hypothetical protein n=1 Tax=Micromonospora sp. HM5-17 TaxID=2487710 RepID=UPI0011CE641F|nr:hypothetical protein [Micromonospora sp. HM5-17]